MSFEAFNNEEIKKIVDHTLECMSKEALERQIQEYGSLEKVHEHLAAGFKNEQAVMDIFKWYGGKEKAMEAALQSPKDPEEFEQIQDENHKIYRQFMTAKETGDLDLEKEAVERLAENYKTMFMLDNARNILLDLAKEYLQMDKLAEIMDRTYGEGCAQYVANAINRYYGV